MFYICCNYINYRQLRTEYSTLGNGMVMVIVIVLCLYGFCSTKVLKERCFVVYMVEMTIKPERPRTQAY